MASNLLDTAEITTINDDCSNVLAYQLADFIAKLERYKSIGKVSHIPTHILSYGIDLLKQTLLELV